MDPPKVTEHRRERGSGTQGVVTQPHGSRQCRTPDSPGATWTRPPASSPRLAPPTPPPALTHGGRRLPRSSDPRNPNSAYKWLHYQILFPGNSFRVYLPVGLMAWSHEHVSEQLWEDFQVGKGLYSSSVSSPVPAAGRHGARPTPAPTPTPTAASSVKPLWALQLVSEQQSQPHAKPGAPPPPRIRRLEKVSHLSKVGAVANYPQPLTKDPHLLTTCFSVGINSRRFEATCASLPLVFLDSFLSRRNRNRMAAKVPRAIMHSQWPTQTATVIPGLPFAVFLTAAKVSVSYGMATEGRRWFCSHPLPSETRANGMASVWK